LPPTPRSTTSRSSFNTTTCSRLPTKFLSDLDISWKEK
jgi:hypothetical protein